jgi:hypothetical protein
MMRLDALASRRLGLRRWQMLIALGSSTVASYPAGGGHWSWFLQYPLGLRALGHEVFWLEVLKSTGRRERDLRLIRNFFTRIRGYGLSDTCALLLVDDTDVQDPERGEVFGRSRDQFADAIRSTELFWNLGCTIREPLLGRFRHRVLIDTDPGHLQIAAQTWDLGIDRHHAFLTVGAKIHDSDCGVPTLGHAWRHFLPFVHLPMWQLVPDPGPAAPFTSITQWTWEELHFGGRVLSASKRAAYLRYADLPRRTQRPFELAANIGTHDPAHDRRTLERGGWRLAEPHSVAPTPEDYRAYIGRSRAEILCPKPVYRELRTGWFSDRSVCYLASGRPVLAEETGFSDRIPAGRGVVAFQTVDEAVAATHEIDSDYARHQRAARELAETCFDARRVLPKMIAASQ